MAEVVVFGSASMDFTFKASAFPRPGDQVEGRVTVRPGGKGLYQAIACKRLRAVTTYIGSLGTDDYGRRILDLLRGERVETLVADHVPSIEDESFSTGIVGIIAAPGETTSYIACRPQERTLAGFIRESARGVIAKCQALLVTFDTDRAALETIVGMAHAAQKAVVINASPATNLPLSIVAGARWVIATREEALGWLRLAGHYSETTLNSIGVKEIGQTLLEFGPDGVVINLGEKGCMLCDRTGTRAYSAFSATDMMIGFTGARSAFCAGFTVACAESVAGGSALDELKLVNFASAARLRAGLSVSGVDAMPKRDDVDAYLTGRSVERT